MSDLFLFILSLSIIPAALFGVLRFRKIDKSYYPFIYNVVAALLAEIAQRVLTLNGMPYSFIGFQNVFSFIDFYLFLWLFHNWGLLNYKRANYLTVIIIFLVIWIVTTFNTTNPWDINSFTFNGISRTNFYFRSVYSLGLVFLGITAFGKVIIQEPKNIFTSAKFWICLGIITFYTFFSIISITQISILKISVSKIFQNYLQSIVVYCNLLANLFYGVAVLWIPQKKNFINLS
jgi:hypothetical protein